MNFGIKKLPRLYRIIGIKLIVTLNLFQGLTGMQYTRQVDKMLKQVQHDSLLIPFQPNVLLKGSLTYNLVPSIIA